MFSSPNAAFIDSQFYVQQSLGWSYHLYCACLSFIFSLGHHMERFPKWSYLLILLVYQSV